MAPAGVASLQPGTTFAEEFRVVRRLREGGMGAVYVVEQLGTGRQRALKIMLPQLVADPKLRARFEQEARIGSRIESEHVVEVVGAGVDRATGTPWLAMELLRGEDLACLVRRTGPLPASRTLKIVEQLSHAVSAAHAAGIVHRDLKPENVFIAEARRTGAKFMVKVLDFGIAKITAEATIIQTGTIGSPFWMAPEQTAQGSVIGPQTDVWAIGLIVFYMLTGRFFWRAADHDEATFAQVLREVVLDPIPRASQRAEDVAKATALPPGFDDWFACSTARSPSARFPDASSQFQALRAVFEGRGPAFAPPAAALAPTFDRALKQAPASASPTANDPSPTEQKTISVQSPGMATTVGTASVALAGGPASVRSTRRRWATLATVLGILTLSASAVLLIPRSGRVTIDVADSTGTSVSQVEIYVDDKKRCDTAPCFVPGVSPGPHAVRVTAEHYERAADKIVAVESRRDATVQFSLVRAKAGLKVAGSQPGLMLYLDGRQVGPLPQDLREVAPGAHQIEVAGPDGFYTPLEKAITLNDGELEDLGVVALKVARGKLTVVLATPGASVFLVSGSDRRVLPHLPSTVDLDASRAWSILATKPGYSDYMQAVSFDDGQPEKTLAVTLDSKSAPRPRSPAPTAAPSTDATVEGGFLNINSIPPSTCFVDGRPLGKTPLVHVPVSAGEHTVNFLDLDDGLAKTITVTVGAGETKPAVAKLN